MRIDENHHITSDAHNFTLHFEREGELNEKTGKRAVSKWKTYHGTLLQALLAYQNSCLKDCSRLDEIIDMLKGSEERISKLVGKSLLKSFK